MFLCPNLLSRALFLLDYLHAIFWLAVRNPHTFFSRTFILYFCAIMQSLVSALLEKMSLSNSNLLIRVPVASCITIYQALEGKGGADVFKPEMVAKLFDSYADTFDEHLQGKLGYRTPEILNALLSEAARGPGDASSSGSGNGTANGTAAAAAAAAVSGAQQQQPQPRWRRCVDLGCGTGLMGVLVRSACDRLEGVDLSAGMIQQARARGTLYDHLEVGEVVQYLDQAVAASAASTATVAGATNSGGIEQALAEGARLAESPPCSSSSGGGGGGGVYDLVLAADVLVYISDLKPLFQAVARACVPGALYGFSTEKLGEQNADCPGFKLRETGRFAHRTTYVKQLLKDTGFELVKVKSTEIRKNLGEPVIGDVVVARRL
jgi:predicted TPR repeat methyltransferase